MPRHLHEKTAPLGKLAHHLQSSAQRQFRLRTRVYVDDRPEPTFADALVHLKPE